MDSIFGDVIYAYTRKQAIADGYQVKLTDELGQMARQMYKYPVYMTSGVWSLIEESVNDADSYTDVPGIVWDILWMSVKAARSVNHTTSKFEVLIVGPQQEQVKHTMLAQCGPTDIDDPAPAITIMLPGED